MLVGLGATAAGCLRAGRHACNGHFAIGAAVACTRRAIQGVGDFNLVVMSNLLYLAVTIGRGDVGTFAGGHAVMAGSIGRRAP